MAADGGPMAVIHGDLTVFHDNRNTKYNPLRENQACRIKVYIFSTFLLIYSNPTRPEMKLNQAQPVTPPCGGLKGGGRPKMAATDGTAMAA